MNSCCDNTWLKHAMPLLWCCRWTLAECDICEFTLTYENRKILRRDQQFHDIPITYNTKHKEIEVRASSMSHWLPRASHIYTNWNLIDDSYPHSDLYHKNMQQCPCRPFFPSASDTHYRYLFLYLFIDCFSPILWVEGLQWWCLPPGPLCSLLYR